MEQWEKEEVARKKLMQEIFEDQKRQIQEKCTINLERGGREGKKVGEELGAESGRRGEALSFFKFFFYFLKQWKQMRIEKKEREENANNWKQI
jgi:hypothetical protein